MYGRLRRSKRVAVTVCAWLRPAALVTAAALVGVAAAAQPPQLVISGLSERQEQNVRAFLRLARADCQTPMAIVRRDLREAPSGVADALRALGHYEPRVVERSLAQTPDGADGPCWRAQLKIDPGPPVRLSEVRVDLVGAGQDDPELRAVIRERAPAEGDVLDHGRYDRLRDGLIEVATDRGYFDAALTRRRLEVDPAGRQARVLLRLVTGERYRIGRVRFCEDRDNCEQEVEFQRAFLARFNPIAPGTPYQTDQLLALQRALLNSDYFASAQVETLRDERGDGTVPVVVFVEPASGRQYTAGIGFGTDTGPRVRAGIDFRHLNRRGHRAQINSAFSGIRSNATIAYEIPLSKPASDRMRLSFGVLDEQTDGVESRQLRLRLERQQARGERWLFTGFLALERDRFNVGGGSNQVQLLRPGVNVSYVRRGDAARFAQRGLRLDAELSGAATELISDAQLLRLQLGLRGVLGAGARGRILWRADVGANVFSELESLPSYLRFFAGGDRSVRGWGYKDLSPRNDAGERVGGQYLFTASLEYERLVRANWGVAAFYDVGNAFNTIPGDVFDSAGVGARWYSPVGAVRVDIAERLDDGDLRVHVYLQPEF